MQLYVLIVQHCSRASMPACGSRAEPVPLSCFFVFVPPQPKDWSISMNKKERRLALATALQSAAPDMVVVDTVAEKVADKKTKSLLAMLETVGVDAMERKVLLITKEKNEHVTMAGRNIAKLALNSADAISVFDVLHADKIVVEAAALEHIQSFYGGKQQA